MTTQHAHLPSDIPLESVDLSGFSLALWENMPKIPEMIENIW